MQILALSLLISIIKLGDTETDSVWLPDTANINCGTERIQIISANYFCSTDNRAWDATDAKSRLALACDYKHSCAFNPKGVFGDPYRGCAKKFDYAYLCTCNFGPNFCAEKGEIEEICTRRKKCDSNVALDIVFLMDESGSIDENEWNSVIDFITRVITWDINEVSYVSLVEFGSVKTESTSDDFTQFLDFTQATPANRAQMISALKNNPWTAGGFTCTADAVERTLKLFGEWDSNNNINNERANLLFLITDGEPSCFGAEEVVCPGLTAMVSNSNVEIALIGVGDGLDALTWTDKLECLYNNKEKDTFYVSTFSSEDFARIEGDLRAKTCVQPVVIGSESIPVISTVPYLSSLFMKSTESQLSSVQNDIYLLCIIVFCLLPLNLFVCFRMVYWCLSQKNAHVTFYDKARQNDPEQL